MSNGTAPAWQAREMAREKALDRMKQAIQSEEDEFENRLDLYRFVQQVVDSRLSGSARMGFMDILPGIPWAKRKEVLDVLVAIDAAIAIFGRAPEERFALWAKLLEWSAAQIANTHISALQALEVSNPKLIFGAESAMTEVPVE